MEWILLVLIAWLAWYVWDTLQAKELALAHVKRYAAQTGIQILDEVVSRSSLKIQRNKQGTVQLARAFDFEFTALGDTRYHGKVLMLGRTLRDISVEPYAVGTEDDF